MADINLSPYTADQQAMNRRRRMAEAMQQQSITPIEMPTMPGVAISPYAGLAKILQGYIAGKNLSKADKEEKDYENQVSEDTARLFRNMGKTETVLGDIITPAQEARFEPPVPIPENENRRQELVNLIAPDPTNAARAAIGYNLMRPEDRERITNLPSMTEGREIPAVAEERGASRQVPLLSADLLNPTNPLAMKTGQGKQMLAQYLMQQEAQKQAAAQADLAASRQIQSVSPGATLFQGGKPIYTNPKDSPLREIKTNNPVTGMPETRFYPENVLVAMGGIPDQYKGFAAELIMSNNLPANITNNPQLLNLVGSQLNKAAGQVTPQDVANYMLRVAETRAKLGYEGIPFPEPTPLVPAGNPLVKPILPKGVPLNAMPTGKFTPDGKPVYQTPDGKNHVEDK